MMEQHREVRALTKFDTDWLWRTRFTPRLLFVHSNHHRLSLGDSSNELCTLDRQRASGAMPPRSTGRFRGSNFTKLPGGGGGLLKSAVVWIRTEGDRATSAFGLSPRCPLIGRFRSRRRSRAPPPAHSRSGLVSNSGRPVGGGVMGGRDRQVRLTNDHDDFLDPVFTTRFL